MQEAFEHLELPTPQETLDQLLEPFLAEGCVGEAPFRAMAREQFRSATVSFAQFKAQRQAKERQRVAARARARLLLFKATLPRLAPRALPGGFCSALATPVRQSWLIYPARQRAAAEGLGQGLDAGGAGHGAAGEGAGGSVLARLHQRGRRLPPRRVPRAPAPALPTRAAAGA